MDGVRYFYRQMIKISSEKTEPFRRGPFTKGWAPEGGQAFGARLDFQQATAWLTAASSWQVVRFFFSGVVVRWAVARETTSASSVSMFTSDSSSDETIQEKEVESAEFPSRSDVMSSTTCFVCLTVSCSSSDESESSAMRLAMVKDLLGLALVSVGDDRLVA